MRMSVFSIGSGLNDMMDYAQAFRSDRFVQMSRAGVPEMGTKTPEHIVGIVTSRSPRP
jgi:hypothetical protein